jgi:hypothetical protein
MGDQTKIPQNHPKFTPNSTHFGTTKSILPSNRATILGSAAAKIRDQATAP